MRTRHVGAGVVDVSGAASPVEYVHAAIGLKVRYDRQFERSRCHNTSVLCSAVLYPWRVPPLSWAVAQRQSPHAVCGMSGMSVAVPVFAEVARKMQPHILSLIHG